MTPCFILLSGPACDSRVQSMKWYLLLGQKISSYADKSKFKMQFLYMQSSTHVVQWGSRDAKIFKACLKTNIQTSKERYGSSNLIPSKKIQASWKSVISFGYGQMVEKYTKKGHSAFSYKIHCPWKTSRLVGPSITENVFSAWRISINKCHLTHSYRSVFFTHP